MKKIVITGGIGYIGTELCKIYSWRKLAEQDYCYRQPFYIRRVNQLRNWNINFVNEDITNPKISKNFA
jgi:nucleoside-diphosphate-sugar epimerase